MTDVVANELRGIVPFALKDAPSFIERQFPVGRISAEAYKERKANVGQTLTALGSYWKGRKPLILVRAVVLGCLLPATKDPATDLEVFLKLMAMDDSAFGRRFDGSAADFARLFPHSARKVASNEHVVWRKKTEPRIKERAPDAYTFALRFPVEAAQFTEVVEGRWRWRDDLNENERAVVIAETFAGLPYKERLKHVRRAEECDERELLAPVWPSVNRHLGTRARDLNELVEQLGIARFGHRPKVADTFCGGGSIPFEAARVGCDVYASDLNPVACMLTWGAFNIIGASKEQQAEIEAEQKRVAAAVDAEITQLEVEHDVLGNRAKAYIYCLETLCPKTGWMVPMAPSWVISQDRRTVAKLVPDPDARRYEIAIHSGVSAAEMEEAKVGTLRDGRLAHIMNPERSGVEIKTIRGDWRDADGGTGNRLRLWEKADFKPRPDDVYQERLYCIQWITKDSLHRGRQETSFAAVTADDIVREAQVAAIVAKNLSAWQEAGLVPDMPIEPGENTNQPIRERGWTYWHHLFSPRQLLLQAIIQRVSQGSPVAAALAVSQAKGLDRASNLCQWSSTPAQDLPLRTFVNQALNTLVSWGVRSSFSFMPSSRMELKGHTSLVGTYQVRATSAPQAEHGADLVITDPPYADAVNYHEITEFFIAWLRKNPPPPFAQWTWDSRRDLAIKGKDEQFRRDMVAAYAAMTRLMPDNGLQVVMFTHQDAGVWADLGSILWAAGLSVTAAWNIVTETESALKEGNYVQGTVNLVLRKRTTEANARRMEIEAEIEEAVAEQIDRLTALDDAWHERTNAETLYTDGDLTLAAYAAALQVVTSYSTIDRQPLDRDLYRKVAKGERTMLRDLIDYAASVANRRLVPEGFEKGMWTDLTPSERFYVRMLDMEAKGNTKVADFQNFAKSFAYGGYADVMASTAANSAALAGAAELKGRQLDGEGFAGTQLRQILFAIWKVMDGNEPDPKRGVTILKTEYAADYWQRRSKLIALASYIAGKTSRTRPSESVAAHELAEALKLDRV